MSFKNIAIALSKAQGELSQPKKDKKGYHGNMYADLSNILSSIKEPFRRNGLSVVQIPSCTTNDVTVTTILHHSSGESITSTTTLPAKIMDPQKAGAAITYARRYALISLAGIAGEEDDDGVQASGLVKPMSSQNLWKQKLAVALLARDIPKDIWRSIAEKMQGKEISELDQILEGFKRD